MTFKGRIIGGGFLILTGCLFAGANAVLLARGAARWADSGWEKIMYGGIASAVPFVIAIGPLAIWFAWKQRRRAWALAGCFMYIFFIGYNLLGASGAIALVRSDAVSARKFDAARDRDRTTQRAALEKQRNEIPAARPPGMVEGLLQIERTKPHWGMSDECQDMRNNAVRKFCANYAKLRGELAAGRSREKITADIAALDKQSGSAGWVADIVDPQSETVAAGLTALGFPVRADQVQPLLPLATPLALEIGALVLVGLGFVVLGLSETALLARDGVPISVADKSGEARTAGGIGTALLPAPPPAIPKPRMQKDLAEWFFRECTRPVASGVLSEEAWYQAYCRICEQSQDVPLPLADFRAMAKQFVPSMRTVNGREFYEGMLPLVPREGAA